MVFERFRLWLSGSFVCVRCGERFLVMSFGFGESICPGCYDGEVSFLFFDGSYWLNRLMCVRRARRFLVCINAPFGMH